MALDDYTNYGNNLQKYALQHTLKKFVDYTEVLWHNANNFLSETGEITWLPTPMPLNADPIRSRQYFLREVVRVSKTKEFENRYIKTRFDLPYLEDIADEYDFFVIGSDQVWQPAAIQPKYFLNFAPREKKIAYAASIAAPKIPDKLKEFFYMGLITFEHISVREESSVKIIKELTGQDALLVLDPTMLLTPEEWLEIAQKPSWLNEKYERGYILTYYLRKTPPDEVKVLSQRLNLPVINLLDWDNYWHYVVSPEEFVFLFANATLIFTNSFHGVAFAIVFKKPFIDREIDENKNMSARIPSLLKMFGLENRITTKDFQIKSPLDIDYSLRDKILPTERDKAFNFLLTAINSDLRVNKSGGGIDL